MPTLHKRSALRRMPSLALSLIALALGVFFFTTACRAQVVTKPPVIKSDLGGIVFSCPSARMPRLRFDMHELMRALGLQTTIVSRRQYADGKRTILHYQLKGGSSEDGTLGLSKRPELNIEDEWLVLPSSSPTTRRVAVVSQKEILLAMLQKGRTTQFSDGACQIEALRDQLGLRQNIVAWSTQLAWGWPDGESAQWHRKYWDNGTPRADVKLDEALHDVFSNQSEYSFGCYTAIKISYAHAILDYYQRLSKKPHLAQLIRQRLMHDQEPLVGIEPTTMWSFEKEYDATAPMRPGKLLDLQLAVAPSNFIPGDWIYIVNTDEKSAQRVGYEGSNAIYLGGGKFDDFYNDHQHSYTFEEKLNEVYQWRFGVFNRVRDADKVQALMPEDVQRLSLSPEAGGMLFAFRATPYLFGYVALPRQRQ